MSDKDMPVTTSPSDEQLNGYESRRVASRMMEFYLWIIAAAVVGGRALYVVSISRPSEARFIIQDYYWDFVLSLGVAAFPLVFRLIFGALPIEHIRIQRLTQHKINFSTEPIRPTDTFELNEKPKQAIPNEPLGLLYSYATEARLLAKGIYSRAGVYLLVGVVVAFSGLAFFYAQTPSTTPHTDLYQLLVILVPKFGILFFIEFVAFFFLRQYRSAMDEFRYYDGIARVREEVLGLLQVSALSGKPISPMELVKYDSYFSRSGVLGKGQTTEIIESRKLEQNELDLFQKMIDLLSKAKK